MKILLIILFFSSLSEAASLSLDQAFKAAIDYSEKVKVQENQVGQQKQKINQAIGSIMPSISGNLSVMRQDLPDSALPSAFRKQNIVTSQISLYQPLFQGLREFAALRSIKWEWQAQKAEVEQEKVNLYLSVAQTFYQILFLQNDKELLEKQLKLTQERVGELRKRTSTGRSRKSEYLSSEAQIPTILSDLENNKIQLNQAQENFFLLTGITRQDQISEDITANIIMDSSSLDSHLAKLEKRYDLNILKHRLESSKENIALAKGSRWPKVTLNGNYYLKRTGVMEGADWDVTMNLNVPIFSGGIINSQVSEANLKKIESEYNLTYAKKVAEYEVSNFYATVTGLVQRIDLLKKATEANEKAYKENQRDYPYGLVTNLDVLQSLNNYIQSQRSLTQATLEFKLAQASLKAASGEVL